MSKSPVSCITSLSFTSSISLFMCEFVIVATYVFFVFLFSLCCFSAHLYFLLWRDAKSSQIESHTYYSHIICPVHKTDNSALDTVTRGFSEKTKGLFAPATIILSDREIKGGKKKTTPLVKQKQKQASTIKDLNAQHRL